MFVIAIETELSALASCAETNIMTRNGYQIVNENEMFFVSKEHFLNKYKGNLYMIPGVVDRLLSFEEASTLRNSISSLEAKKLVKIKGSNKNEVVSVNDARYSISLRSSDLLIEADRITCEYNGSNGNVRIVTEESVIDASATNTRFDIKTSNTVLTICASGCFIELSGAELEVLLIGNNNTVCGIAPGITVYSRGRKNTFKKKDSAPTEDPAKKNV
jgi:hypothetical protein